MSPETAGPPVCLNCGEKLLGGYCWRCGQKAVDLRRPLRDLASDFLADVLSLDTRFLRSIGPLLFRPGLLTREHLAGRRARYAPPLRLYLIATLVFFGLITLLPKGEVQVLTEGEPVRLESLPKGTSRITVQFPELFEKGGESAWRQHLKAATERAKAHPREFVDALLANLPRAFFLLLPVFALLIRLFYWRQDRFYLDHLIFALHYHAFAFTILTVRTLVAKLWGPLQLPLWIWLFAYLAMALRRVYGGSRWLTGLKLAGLTVTYTLAFGLSIAALTTITLFLF